MTLSQRMAGDCVAICTVWLVWALLAPVIAGPVPTPQAMHTCPSPVARHGVSGTLKTYTREFDRCAQENRHE